MDFKLLLSLLVIQGAVLVSGGEIWKESKGCYKKGLNPHPHDCHKYLVCTSDAYGRLTPNYYTCPGSDVYSHGERTCVSHQKMQNCKENPPVPDCDHKLIHCEECKTLIVCQKISEENYIYLYSEECKNGTYCDNKKLACTTEMPPECVPHSPCTGAGMFPNIQNCSIFYECAADANGALKSQTFVCPKGKVFNSRGDLTTEYLTEEEAIKKYCKDRKSPSDCHRVKCPGDKLELKSYPGDNRYYVLCTTNGVNFVIKCEDGKEFNGLECAAPSPKPPGGW